MSTHEIEQLKELHRKLEDVVEARLREFDQLWLDADEERLFEELVFCLLTPQSRARSCWAAVEKLSSMGELRCPVPARIQMELKGVRFSRRKAEYICMARDLFMLDGMLSVRARIDPENLFQTREWLVGNVKGMGYKEASHFLRNIGLGRDLAILDRHILKSLVRYGVVPDYPRSLSRSRYLKIESEMSDFARSIDIPMAHLDMVLWYMGAGEVFK
ncbi:N-glycosylase/DNA lyase [Methanothrix thermoacetophila]|uniref:8-oxoguanine DNA glycosylase/AP lyase n=1 Tax=Methanothrix thermoacetophila (strain DSM 6194 / JCM 14653 / NBRC 101360 / PT) TaxID=349307 RepID=A0B5Z0_METTP|nr:N-glycosylase/DNA lyase [Methanothrix thermoacetophila]ABK14114.1 HhH-GPD family protein [Methanothrix thermoacetophila PT]